jgi:hypothetical protein
VSWLRPKHRGGAERHLFTDAELRSLKSLISQGVTIEGAPISADGGVLVDGQLIQCCMARTKAPILLSTLSRIVGSVFDCDDLLIDGRAESVVIVARGRLEIGPSAVVVGTLFRGPQCQLYIAATADVQDLSIKPIQELPMWSLSPENAKEFLLKRSTAAVTQGAFGSMREGAQEPRMAHVA